MISDLYQKMCTVHGRLSTLHFQMALAKPSALALLGLGFNGFGQLDGGSQEEKSKKSAEEVIATSPKQLLVSANPTFHVSVAWDSVHIFNYSGSILTGGRWCEVIECAKSKLNEHVTKIEAETTKGIIIRTASHKMHVALRSTGDGDWTFREISSADKKCAAFGVLSNNKIYALMQDDGMLCEVTMSTEAAENADKKKLSSVLQFGPSLPVPGGVVIAQMACGIDHVLSLSTHGDMFSFGLNSRGQLGLGDILPQTRPTLVKALAGIKALSIACGHWHSLALSEFGDVYSWGWNEHGQLGHSADTPVVAVPSLIELPPEDQDDVNFVSIGCGERHSVAVSEGGSVYTWGWNKYGQLGTRGRTGELSEDIVAKKPGVMMDLNMRAVGVYCGHWNTLLVVENDCT